MKTNKDIFVAQLLDLINNKELVKFTLTSPKDKTSDLKKVIVSAVELKKAYGTARPSPACAPSW